MKTNLSSVALAIAVFASVLCSSCDRSSEAPQAAQPTGAEKPATPAVAGYQGNFEAADCQLVVGWVLDSSKPEAPVSVDVFDGTTPLGTAPSDIFRQDLKDAGKGGGKHGFSFTLPQSVKDGAQHSIAVKVSGTDSAVYGSPRTITCPPAAASQP
jgi:hypothetical protein